MSPSGMVMAFWLSLFTMKNPPSFAGTSVHSACVLPPKSFLTFSFPCQTESHSDPAAMILTVVSLNFWKESCWQGLMLLGMASLTDQAKGTTSRTLSRLIAEQRTAFCIGPDLLCMIIWEAFINSIPVSPFPSLPDHNFFSLGLDSTIDVSLQSLDLQIAGQDHIGELLEGQSSIFIFITILKQLHDLPVCADFAQYFSHIIQIDETLPRSVVEGEHFLESDQAGLGEDAFLSLLLGLADFDLIFNVETKVILFTPCVDGGDMPWCQIGVYFEQQFFEGDAAILVVIEEVIETGGY